jgi:hypothetical protein
LAAAETAAAATAAIVATAALATALNDALNSSSDKGQSDKDGGQSEKNQGNKETKSGTTVPSDRPQPAPKLPRSGGPFCQLAFAQCLKKCEPLCGIQKGVCQAGCAAAFVVCRLAATMDF